MNLEVFKEEKSGKIVLEMDFDEFTDLFNFVAFTVKWNRIRSTMHGYLDETDKPKPRKLDYWLQVLIKGLEQIKGMDIKSYKEKLEEEECRLDEILHERADTLPQAEKEKLKKRLLKITKEIFVLD